MKLFKFIMMLMAFTLGLGLGEVTTLSDSSSVSIYASAAAKNLKIAIQTVIETTTHTVDPCAATVSLASVPVNLELRSQQVLVDLPLPTTTITCYSTVRSTTTVPHVDTIYLSRSRTSVKPLPTTTITRYTTVRRTTTVPPIDYI